MLRLQVLVMVERGGGGPTVSLFPLCMDEVSKFLLHFKNMLATLILYLKHSYFDPDSLFYNYLLTYSMEQSPS